jgi:hypothetical protein
MDGVTVGVTDGEAPNDLDGLGVILIVGVTVGVSVGVGVILGVFDGLGVILGVLETLGVLLGVGGFVGNCITKVINYYKAYINKGI